MGSDIKKLTKEELITVIAEMHDSVQNWFSYGYSDDDVEKLNKIGDLALKESVEKHEMKIKLSDIKI